MSLWTEQEKSLKEELGNGKVNPLPYYTRLWILDTVESTVLDELAEIQRIETWRKSNPDLARIEDNGMAEDIELYPDTPNFRHYPKSQQTLKEMTDRLNCLKVVYFWLSDNPPPYQQQ